MRTGPSRRRGPSPDRNSRNDLAWAFDLIPLYNLIYSAQAAVVSSTDDAFESASGVGESGVISETLTQPGSQADVALASDRRADIDTKSHQVGAILREVGCDGLLLLEPENVAWLSSGAVAGLSPAIVSRSYAFLKDLRVRNVEAEKPEMEPTALADTILTFFTGISMEQHLRVSKTSMNQKVDHFMKVVRKL